MQMPMPLNVGLANDVTNVTGFAPEMWDWVSGFETLVVESNGVHTLTGWIRDAYVASGWSETENNRLLG
jgi:hypothetical protein